LRDGRVRAIDDRPEIRGTASLPSDRKFGYTFAAVFALIGALSLWKSGAAAMYALPLSLLFLAVTLVRPDLLRPLNVLWFRLGALLHKVVSPVVLLGLYAVVIVPSGLVMKLLRNDPLHRTVDPARASYWEDAAASGATLEQMRRQY